MSDHHNYLLRRLPQKYLDMAIARLNDLRNKHPEQTDWDLLTYALAREMELFDA